MDRAAKLGSAELRRRVAYAVLTGHYRILAHARQRCGEREVLAPHIENVLICGRAVPGRDRYDADLNSWSYCFEGAGDDIGPLRVVVAFEDLMLIVTVVRLERSEA